MVVLMVVINLFILVTKSEIAWSCNGKNKIKFPNLGDDSHIGYFRKINKNLSVEKKMRMKSGQVMHYKIFVKRKFEAYSK